MAFSDARNERDRAETGKNSSNHGGSMGGRGTMGQQQDRRNMETARRAGNVAPGVGRSFSPNDKPMNATYGSLPSFQPRRTQNPTPSYDMTPGNLAKMAAMMGGTLMGGSPLTAMGMMGRPLGSMAGPAIGGLMGFEGYRGAVNGPGDYDGPNRFATNGSAMFPNQQPQMQQGIQAAGAPKPPMAQPGMGQQQMAPGQFNVPGPSQYGVNLPSYGYFGQPPALKRPQSAIMGGI
jgi:hypothetical protein